MQKSLYIVDYSLTEAGSWEISYTKTSVHPPKAELEMDYIWCLSKFLTLNFAWVDKCQSLGYFCSLTQAELVPDIYTYPPTITGLSISYWAGFDNIINFLSIFWCFQDGCQEASSSSPRQTASCTHTPLALNLQHKVWAVLTMDVIPGLFNKKLYRLWQRP